MTRLLAATVATAAVLAGGGGSAVASPIAFSNEVDPDKAYRVDFVGPSLIAGVTLQFGRPANVLVQFTSTATAETAEGCPCSVRAFLRMDGGPLMPVKHVNLGWPDTAARGGQVRDRHSLDGSLVFPAEPGTHRFELLVQQVTGKSIDLRIYHPNLQAIAFPH